MYKAELPQPTPYDFVTWNLNGIPVVHVAAAVDALSVDTMRRELLAAAERSKVIVVDMSEDPFCGSEGLNLLDEVASMLAARGGELRAVITHRITLMCLLKMPNRTTLVRVFPALDRAVFATQQDQEPQLQAA